MTPDELRALIANLEDQYERTPPALRAEISKGIDLAEDIIRVMEVRGRRPLGQESYGVQRRA